MRHQASLVSGAAAGLFIDASRMDLSKYAARPALGRALFSYLLHVANDNVRAAELARRTLDTPAARGSRGWWWRTMLGFALYRLGSLREAEGALRAAIRDQPSVLAYHLLAKVAVRLDQPRAAAQAFAAGVARFPQDTTLIAGLARVYEALGDHDASVAQYRRLVSLDSTHAEAVASLASNHFYSWHPEFALLLFRRLLQTGVRGAELFNNMALCAFHAQQYDLALGLFRRALRGAADDATTADIWYNQGTVAVALGDTSLGYQVRDVWEWVCFMDPHDCMRPL